MIPRPFQRWAEVLEEMKPGLTPEEVRGTLHPRSGGKLSRAGTSLVEARARLWDMILLDDVYFTYARFSLDRRLEEIGQPMAITYRVTR